NKIGRGKVVFVAVPDLVGEDERMTTFAAHLLAHLAGDTTPVKVDGDVEYLINRNSRGWVITVFNDNGVFKPQQGLAQVERNAIVNATITLRDAAIANASEWTSDRTLAIKKQTGLSDSVTVKIAPGGIGIIEIQT